jgi:hypothetical protein
MKWNTFLGFIEIWKKETFNAHKGLHITSRHSCHADVVNGYELMEWKGTVHL